MERKSLGGFFCFCFAAECRLVNIQDRIRKPLLSNTNNNEVAQVDENAVVLEPSGGSSFPVGGCPGKRQQHYSKGSPGYNFYPALSPACASFLESDGTGRPHVPVHFQDLEAERTERT